MPEPTSELQELLHEARVLARQIRLSNRLQAAAPDVTPTARVQKDLALVLRCADLIVAIGETADDAEEPAAPRAPVLDIGRLVAQGLLEGAPRGYLALSDGRRLPYTLTRSGSDLRLSVDVGGHESVVSLVSTRPRFGGARYWLLCPGLPGRDCGKRFLHLHLPAGSNRIACRKCHRLRYEGRAQPAPAFDLQRRDRRASA